jgi:hypothetical protein
MIANFIPRWMMMGWLLKVASKSPLIAQASRSATVFDYVFFGTNETVMNIGSFPFSFALSHRLPALHLLPLPSFLFAQNLPFS